MPSGSRYRVAIVGAGAIAGAHLKAVQALGDRAEVVAVADLDGDRATGFATQHGVPQAFTDVPTLLEQARPDLVSVCTPPGAHRETVLAALAAGAWVWCEKPPVLSLAEYDELAGAEGEQGPYVGYVFQHRFGSAARTFREQVAAGTLGRPHVAVCHTLWYRDHDYYAVPWRGKWETEGGGPAMGHGIHQMDLMLSLLGDWREITALMGTLDRDVQTEDVSVAAVSFESGALATVVNSVLSPRQTSYLRFDLTDATVEVEHLYGYDNSNWTWTPREGVDASGWAPATDEASSHTAQLGAYLDAMDAGERPPASGHDGRRSLELVAALYQSAITGQPVRRTDLKPGNPFYTALDGGGRYTPHRPGEDAR
ncbi:Gfo/Idh/MocA family oxidoreductase [Kineosporia sp. J2-2]|uniref:Gfo/Idh/MocA family oxidoreductase n=1 Tax=Kineosporia corallincola TaxID=2835133 RepID=A0ABS5TKN2_9ACTN|nr:Gfo/Idh/MocA family oxidoreductase [Kineosporia corallincola]MBT0771660.1 Gfo/Idh/MocA family oxidoreductase [Kineosporia corallincola]